MLSAKCCPFCLHVNELTTDHSLIGKSWHLQHICVGDDDDGDYGISNTIVLEIL